MTVVPGGLLALLACPTPEAPSLVLEGPAEVRVEQLGPVPAPRVGLDDGQRPEGTIWSFSRTGVARREGEVVVAEGPGEVDVVAEWEGERVSWHLVVELHTELSFVDAPSTLAVGEAVDLKVSTRAGGQEVGSGEVSWTSSDPSVVTVLDGRVTGAGAGTAFVTASARGASAMIELAVAAPSVP